MFSYYSSHNYPWKNVYSHECDIIDFLFTNICATLITTRMYQGIQLYNKNCLNACAHRKDVSSAYILAYCLFLFLSIIVGFNFDIIKWIITLIRGSVNAYFITLVLVLTPVCAFMVAFEWKLRISKDSICAEEVLYDSNIYWSITGFIFYEMYSVFSLF